MQVTIEIPDKLARQLEPEREHLAEIIQLGLCRRWSNANSLWREIVAFLARGPQPGEIVEFHASEASAERLRELLDKNREGVLSAEEEAELDEMCHLDHLVTALKAEAWRHVRGTA
jgi:hypothetical protein